VGAGTRGGGECGYIGPYHSQTPSPSGETQAKKSIYQVVTFAVAAFWREPEE